MPIWEKIIRLRRYYSCSYKKLQEANIVKGTKLNVDLKQLGYDVIAFIGIYLEKAACMIQWPKNCRKYPK